MTSSKSGHFKESVIAHNFFNRLFLNTFFNRTPLVAASHLVYFPWIFELNWICFSECRTNRSKVFCKKLPWKILQNLTESSYHWVFSCVKSVPIRSFSWFVFSYIRTEYGDVQSISPCLVRMWENCSQEKLRIGRLFTQ